MEFAFLFADWLGKPVWMWLGFISIVIALLVFDLGVLHRDNHEIVNGGRIPGHCGGVKAGQLARRRPLAKRAFQLAP